MKLLMLLVVGASCVPQSTTPASHLRGEALRDHVNTHQSHWKAEVPKRSRLNHLMKVEHTQVPVTAAKAPVQTASASEAYASGFDAREQWPNCPSIGYIRDQSECGACWAFAAAETLSDRICIASNAAQKPVLSAQDILTCCTGTCGSGCDGGVPYYAWEWLTSTGAATGGGYYENFGCKPFSVQPCGTYTVNGVTHTYDQSYCLTGADVATPACTSSCSNAAYNVSYANDKYFAQSAYSVDSDVQLIQLEIMTNGPVEAGFNVYSDFDLYVSGIYVQTGGSLEGGHAVKIIGWGAENGTDYWLVANSWDTNWGEDGFFRIIRGVDECGIESSIVAGLAGAQYYATTTQPTTVASPTTVPGGTTGAAQPTTTTPHCVNMDITQVVYEIDPKLMVIDFYEGPLLCERANCDGTWFYIYDNTTGKTLQTNCTAYMVVDLETPTAKPYVLQTYPPNTVLTSTPYAGCYTESDIDYYTYNIDLDAMTFNYYYNGYLCDTYPCDGTFYSVYDPSTGNTYNTNCTAYVVMDLEKATTKPYVLHTNGSTPYPITQLTCGVSDQTYYDYAIDVENMVINFYWHANGAFCFSYNCDGTWYQVYDQATENVLETNCTAYDVLFYVDPTKQPYVIPTVTPTTAPPTTTTVATTTTTPKTTVTTTTPTTTVSTTTPTTTVTTTTSSTTVSTTTTTGAPTTTCATALSCPAISFDANSVAQGPITCASGTWKYICTSSSKSLNVKRVSDNNKWAPVSTVKCMGSPAGWYIDNVLITNLTDITQVKCLAPS